MLTVCASSSAPETSSVCTSLVAGVLSLFKTHPKALIFPAAKVLAANTANAIFVLINDISFNFLLPIAVSIF